MSILSTCVFYPVWVRLAAHWQLEHQYARMEIQPAMSTLCYYIARCFCTAFAGDWIVVDCVPVFVWCFYLNTRVANQKHVVCVAFVSRLGQGWMGVQHLLYLWYNMPSYVQEVGKMQVKLDVVAHYTVQFYNIEL